MHRYEDYYRILQVHYLAGPEVIESAYKRLAKKYHPDISRNKSSEETMKKINQAYEVISDPERRKQYDQEQKDKYNRPCGGDCSQKNAHGRNMKSFAAAKAVLDEYFRGIMDNRFDCSYELISDIDKQNISRDDFIIWQSAVSKVFHLKEYSLRIYGAGSGKTIDRHIFSDTVEFGVDVVEHNTVMDMMEKNSFTKTTVLEDGKWLVYLGYKDLQPLIDKFKSLTGLLTAKTVISELIESHSRIDSLTGLLNQRGIIERIENEILRYNRYGNIFSLIMCDVDIVKAANASMKQEALEYAVKFAGEILLNSLRKLDAVGRWGEKSFLILLPETGRASALKAAQKLSRILKQKNLAYEGRTYGISAKFRTVEYESSLEESLDRVSFSSRIGI